MEKAKVCIYFLITMVIVVLPIKAFGGTAADYLILQDINAYKLMGSGGGNGSGILIATGHFGKDHSDESYESLYFHDSNEIGVNVQITQHAGSDSDKWLLHEIDSEFRDYYGIPDLSFSIKNINGNIIYVFSSGGRDYRWLSGNKIIVIDYTDLMMEKPEPIEVVSAYLAKHPSNLPVMTLAQLRSSESTTKWIKDEMDLRLWLCDKWFEQYQLGKTDQKTVLQEAVKSMNVFLDYREKYYGMSAKDEKNLLAGYLQNNDEPNIRAKLSEYKAWWTSNKSGSLIGMITTCPHRLWGYISNLFRKLFAFFTSLPGKLMAAIG